MTSPRMRSHRPLTHTTQRRGRRHTGLQVASRRRRNRGVATRSPRNVPRRRGGDQIVQGIVPDRLLQIISDGSLQTIVNVHTKTL